jgi:hypothetical protein
VEFPVRQLQEDPVVALGLRSANELALGAAQRMTRMGQGHQVVPGTTTGIVAINLGSLFLPESLSPPKMPGNWSGSRVT